jgi:hypothetical protein
MKFMKLSQNLRKYALNVRSVTLGYAHMYEWDKSEIFSGLISEVHIILIQ